MEGGIVGEERGPEESPTPPIRVPTSFGFEVTLSPHGSETVAFHGDQDVLLSAMSANATGPAVVEIKITDAPAAETPVLPIPGGTFTEYLERELPTHLAATAGEELAHWADKNRVLTDAARAGDDEAFFALLARDPRQFASELTLGRLVTWRTEIDEYNRFFRFKASRFLAPSAAAANAQHRMEEARKKLERVGASQLDLYDQRGKRPLPPAHLARGFYYGLLSLLQGLRAIYTERLDARIRPRQIETELSDFLGGLASLEGASPFLPYVRLAVRLLRDREVLSDAGFGELPLAELVGTKDASPSDTARVIAAAALEVSADTIERLAAQAAPLPLPAPAGVQRFIVGPPTFKLLDFPEVQALVARLTR
jgi:hypothetical protein